MEKKALVSIISPCYNVGKVIHRLLSSIRDQTYSNIELILVNDGSTDNTADIIEEFIPSLKERGIKIIYVYQENQGLGGAIDTGLKYFTGEYLCWPDSDDYLSIDSVEKKVQFLEENQQYQLVRSDAAIFNENNLEKQIGYITGKKACRFKDNNLIEDYIRRKNVVFCPGCHMVKTSAFLEVNPDRSIYPAKRGQNYQLLLPLLYKYKFGYIDEALYNYIIYKGSMSRGDDSYQKLLDRYDEIDEIILNTLEIIPLTNVERKYYTELTIQVSDELKFNGAYKHRNKEELNRLYAKLPFHWKLLTKKILFILRDIFVTS